MQPSPARSSVRSFRMFAVVAVAALAVALGVTACDQGVDDRCQVQSDCESGLVCNKATQKCQTQAEVDAGPTGTASPSAAAAASPRR
jgi:hypothetical protein